jgi:hypothetical protein
MDFCDVLNIPISRSGVKKVSHDRIILVTVSYNLSVAYHFISLFVISGRTLCEVTRVFGIPPCDN